MQKSRVSDGKFTMVVAMEWNKKGILLITGGRGWLYLTYNPRQEQIRPGGATTVALHNTILR